MEIRVNGRFKTVDELREEAIEELCDALENLSDESQLLIGNLWRSDNGYNELYALTEENVNDVLDGWDAWDIINSGIDTDYYYFSRDSYSYDIENTDDVWECIDLKDLAEAILDDEIRYGDLPSRIQDVYDEYTDACEELENMCSGRLEADKVLNAYLNNEADVADLLVVLSRLVNNDEVWAE